ncbi:hypothetical protein LJ739_11945 [Aestuariibacter halophilus]|uniref:Uncharacterized protein n=1 Tax=Fluctibacter halophilus TaxID=226011 RepID=A0ABS8G918_9ALTE|nr:hypothetical protein [Aestuariibacter halophilus]MCC2616954.1 hypothetical protein [Aestuariibacter halophilus]
MSCLTRKLQHNLARYLKRHDTVLEQNPETVRNTLVEKGLCPSDVTTEQMRSVMKLAEQ